MLNSLISAQVREVAKNNCDMQFPQVSKYTTEKYLG